MKKFQIRNIAACWKVSEDEVWEIIEMNGGLEKATFKKVDEHFKDLDWEQKQAEWKAFRGISIKFSHAPFLVNKGFYQNMSRFFDEDDFHLPRGWRSAISINSHFVTFSQCRVFGSKSCDASKWYMYVKVHGTREEMTAGTMDHENNRVYLVPYPIMVKPVKEERQSTPRFMTYLEGMADSTFTQGEMELWMSQKKMRIYTGNIARK